MAPHAAEALADHLCEATPVPLDKVYFVGSGSEAVEAAIPFSCDREALNAAKLAYQRDETVVDAAIELAQCLAGQGASASVVRSAFLLVTDVAGLDASEAASASATAP